MGRPHEFALTLRRRSAQEPWGFSLVGGSDVKTPLIVTRVAFGSPVQGSLQRGDIISKVGSYDSRDIRHQDAQNLFKNAGTEVKVVVQRDTAPRRNTSTGSSNYSPLSVSPHLSPRGQPVSPGYSPAGSALTPVYTSPLTPIDNNYFDPYEYGSRNRSANENGQEVHVTKQPYRTTPLVLPGAKVKRESGPTESYLRHHPNPSVRAPPHHLDTDHLIKQKVANSVLDRISTGDPNKQLVHKQFNSPINVYSEPNILDTIHKQTGVNAQVKKHVKFNPEESETYKALKEEEYIGERVQEISVPPQSKIYAPTKKPAYVINQNPGYTSAIGNDPDNIQQSGSFKRLMMSVLPGSNF